MGSLVTIPSRPIEAVIDPVPRGAEGLVLVHPDHLAAAEAPTHYDVNTDQIVPITQGVVDGWQAAHKRVGEMMTALRAAVEQAKAEAKDITPAAVEEIMALIKAPA